MAWTRFPGGRMRALDAKLRRLSEVVNRRPVPAQGHRSNQRWVSAPPGPGACLAKIRFLPRMHTDTHRYSRFYIAAATSAAATHSHKTRRRIPPPDQEVRRERPGFAARLD
jgi:hypothetical protein